MDFFSQTYNALKGPAGAPQTPLDTIQRLASRLSPSTLLADRRAAVLALKGLSRDWRVDVGQYALAGLLDVLENDAEIDADIGKAVLETLITLCDLNDASPTSESRVHSLKYTDEVLKTERAPHRLFSLLVDVDFYVKHSSLHLLSILLHNRRQAAQAYFLRIQNAAANVLGTLEDKREIIRNSGLSLLQTLLTSNPDIQKLFAFEGAFDRLFALVQREGGLDGAGATTVHDALECVEALLRLNTANQTLLRTSGLSQAVLSLLAFPPVLPPHTPAPQEFALQLWDSQKIANARLVINVVGLLAGTAPVSGTGAKAGNDADPNIYLRCLIEMALASNAPTTLKRQALQLLPANLNFSFISHIITPYMPVPDTNGEEWDRLEPIVSLDALIELIVLGEYVGMGANERAYRGEESLLLRTSGVTAFENYTRKEELRLIILQAMFPSDDPNAPRPSPALIGSLATVPSSPLNSQLAQSIQFAAFLFASLIRSSPRCKQLARQIKPIPVASPGSDQQYFIPADGAPSAVAKPCDEEEAPQSLLSIVSEHLSLSFLSRAHSTATETEQETREWDRLILVYLSLLAQWLWGEPIAVREFLETGGLGLLVEPINQTSNVDPLVQGLCAFLLGVCYEFNHEPGEVTRHTIYAILNRLSVDAITARISLVREDERFTAISPEDIVMPYRFPLLHGISNLQHDAHHKVEIWFDWAFIEFWKSNYYAVQRSLMLDPDTLGASSGQNSESAILVASLREAIRHQASQIEELEGKLKAVTEAKEKETSDLRNQLRDLEAEKEKEADELHNRIASLTSELEEAQLKRTKAENEQEDLLVFLDELSAKRNRDKERLRAAGLDVSDDEVEGDSDPHEDQDE